MTKEEALTLRPGDMVIVPGTENTVVEIDNVNSELFPDDPVAFFVLGGFWRTSRLRKSDDRL